MRPVQIAVGLAAERERLPGELDPLTALSGDALRELSHRSQLASRSHSQRASTRPLTPHSGATSALRQAMCPAGPTQDLAMATRLPEPPQAERLAHWPGLAAFALTVCAGTSPAGGCSPIRLRAVVQAAAPSGPNRPAVSPWPCHVAARCAARQEGERGHDDPAADHAGNNQIAAVR
jgi:hypothetical protein